MKLSFAECKRIQRMNQKELTQYVTTIYGAGVKDTEDELEHAPAERWLDIVRQSSEVMEKFSVWDYDDLQVRLSKEFAPSNVKRIMEILCEQKDVNKC